MPSVPGGEGMSARPDRPRELPGRLRGCFCWTWWTTFGDSCDIGGSRFPGRPSKSLEGTIASEDVFPVGVLEAGGNNGDLDGVLHVVILHSAKMMFAILVRGLLNDARSFVDFMQTKAGAAGDIDENALRALNGIVFEERAGNGAVGASTARFVPVATRYP